MGQATNQKEDRVVNSQSGASNAPLCFQKPILVYLPCYNCASRIEEVLEGIPTELHECIECLVIDNQSTDETVGVVLRVIREQKLPFTIHLIQPKENLGYAGSQKLAYSLACKSDAVDHVIMLHGDGQYTPELLKQFIAYIGSDYSIVNGYRDKKMFSQQEETPVITSTVIKFLSWFESFVTGFERKEWHSGFVMYRTDFLREVPLQCLSPYMHIDGEFLMCAGVLNKKVTSVSIHKRYKGFDFFCGIERMKYVFRVLKLIARFKTGYYHRLFKQRIPPQIDYPFDVLSAGNK